MYVCPNCGSRNIDIDDCEGYSEQTLECYDCGNMCIIKHDHIITVKKGKTILLG